jgi:hypothetical protein
MYLDRCNIVNGYLTILDSKSVLYQPLPFYTSVERHIIGLLGYLNEILSPFPNICRFNFLHQL